MPTKKNRTSGSHPDRHPFTLQDAGVGGGKPKSRTPIAPHTLTENIRGGSSKSGGKVAGLFAHGDNDTQTRVSFGGGKREKPKQTQKLS